MEKQPKSDWKEIKSEATEIVNRFIERPDKDKLEQDFKSLAENIAARLGEDDLKRFKFIEKGFESLGAKYEKDIKELVDHLVDRFEGLGFDRPGRKNMMGNYLYFCKLDYNKGKDLLLPSNKAISDELEKISILSLASLEMLDSALPAAKILLGFMLFKPPIPIPELDKLENRLKVVDAYDMVWDQESFHFMFSMLGTYLYNTGINSFRKKFASLYKASKLISEVVGSKPVGRPPKTRLRERLIRRLGVIFDTLAYFNYAGEIKKAGGWKEYCEKIENAKLKDEHRPDLAKELGEDRAIFVEEVLNHFKAPGRKRSEIYRILGRLWNPDKVIA